MKKFLFATLSALFISTGAVCAQDANNLSVSVLGGWSWHPDLMLNGAKTGMEDGYNVGARLGYGLDGWGMNNLSVGADYFFNTSDYNGSSGARLLSSSFMGNLLYHVPTASPWSFYGGGGVGLVNDDLDGALHGSSAVFGWQALGGTEYAFTPQTSLFAEYRYQNAHDANIGALRDVGNTSNNLSVGVKFNL